MVLLVLSSQQTLYTSITSSFGEIVSGGGLIAGALCGGEEIGFSGGSETSAAAFLSSTGGVFTGEGFLTTSAGGVEIGVVFIGEGGLEGAFGGNGGLAGEGGFEIREAAAGGGGSFTGEGGFTGTTGAGGSTPDGGFSTDCDTSLGASTVRVTVAAGGGVVGFCKCSQCSQQY